MDKSGPVYSRRGDRSLASCAPSPEGETLTEAPSPRFAHESEAELARILDYYRIEWRYEPDVFPIAWNAEGKVIESFAPDFYLPQIDLYLELTTLKQTLVRKKNRKLRWLRQLYPEVRVKLFYGRDFQALMLKYGRTFLNGAGPEAPEAEAPEPAAPAEPIPSPEAPILTASARRRRRRARRPETAAAEVAEVAERA